MALPRAQDHGERDALAVADEVELGAEPTSRPAERMVVGLVGAPLPPAPAAARVARTEVPSRHHRSRSIFPIASSRPWRCSVIASKVPSFDHRLKRPYTDFHEP